MQPWRICDQPHPFRPKTYAEKPAFERGPADAAGLRTCPAADRTFSRVRVEPSRNCPVRSSSCHGSGCRAQVPLFARAECSRDIRVLVPLSALACSPPLHTEPTLNYLLSAFFNLNCDLLAEYDCCAQPLYSEPMYLTVLIVLCKIVSRNYRLINLCEIFQWFLID